MRVLPIFDEIDSDLASFNWQANKEGYASRSVYDKNSTNKTKLHNVSPHRTVLERMLGRKLAKGEQCDHINFNPLDCRRINLRLASIQQNSQHRRPLSSSGYRGVTYHKKSGKWQAQVKHNGKSYYCGLYATAIEASIAAKSKRQELNFFGGAS